MGPTLWISVFGALALRAAADDGAPNVLFILADDLGQGDVGAYVAAYGSYKSHAPSTPTAMSTSLTTC